MPTPWQADSVSDEERRQYAGIILNSGKVLLNILNDVLDLSKIEAGKLQLVEDNFNPISVIRETVELFSATAKAKSLRIDIAVNKLSSANYISDSVRLREMISNLISNAVKFTGAGEVRLRCGAEQNGAWKFEVMDTGLGIPAEEQADPTLPEFPARNARPVLRSFASSFESDEDFAPFYVVPSPYLGTTFQELTTAHVHSGARAHRAWIEGANKIVAGENTNHRGYPTVQLDELDGPYAGVVRIEFQAWVDMPMEACADQDWVSLMTLSSYADDQWYQVQLLNLDSEGTPQLMHVPVYGQSVHDIFQTNHIHAPQREWFTVTVLVDYRSDNAWGSPMLAAWIDGALVSAARFNPRVDPASVPVEKRPDCLDGWDGQDVVQAEALEFAARGGKLAFAAIDDDDAVHTAVAQKVGIGFAVLVGLPGEADDDGIAHGLGRLLDAADHTGIEAVVDAGRQHQQRVGALDAQRPGDEVDLVPTRTGGIAYGTPGAIGNEVRIGEGPRGGGYGHSGELGNIG